MRSHQTRLGDQIKTRMGIQKEKLTPMEEKQLFPEKCPLFGTVIPKNQMPTGK